MSELIEPTESSCRPRLRRELRILPRELGGDLVIEDRHLERRLRLDHITAACAELADGTHTIAEIDAVLAAWTPPLRPASRRAAIRQLFLLDLIDGAERPVHDQAPTTISTLEGARVGCSGSGDCCRSYVLGPLDDAEASRLQALPIAERLPAAGPGPHLIANDGGGWRLAKRGEGCVFQTVDHACGIHRVFGAAAKPRICRTYPLALTRTVAGLRVVDDGECVTFADGATAGRPIAAMLGGIEDVLADPPPFEHPLIEVAEGEPIDFALYLAITDAQRAHAADPQVCPWRAIGRLDEIRVRATVALQGCALRPGGPWAALEAALAAPPAPIATPDASAWDAMIAVCHRLRAACASRTGAGGLVGLGWQRFADLVGATAAWADAEGVHRLAHIPVSDVVVEAARISLCNQLFGRRMYASGSAPGALVGIALAMLMARLGAAACALDARRDRVEPADFSAAHALVQRTLRLLIPDIGSELSVHVGAVASVVADLPPVRGESTWKETKAS